MKTKFEHDSETIDKIYSMYKEKKLIIPSYQRSITWNDEKRRALIKTIESGNPMGAILVYKDSAGYRIIDGLQRVSTLVDYNDNLYKYISVDSINPETLRDFYRLYKDNTEKPLTIEDLQEEIIKQIKNLKKENHLIKNLDMCENLISILNIQVTELATILKLNKSLSLIIEDLLTSEIGNYPIFMIKYNGPEDELPDIFHALNTGAVNLTKYEVISSTWNDKSLHVTENELFSMLKQEVKAKYEKMENDGFVFDFEGKTDILQQEEKINLFELCEALGKLLGERSEDNVLFSQKNSSELGFEVLALLFHGLKFTNNEGKQKTFEYSKPSNIMYFLNDETPAEEVNELLTGIFEVRDELNSALKQFIYTKKDTNSLMQKYMSKHIFKSMFQKKYKIENFNNTIKVIKIDNDISKYKHNIIATILYEEMTGYWSKNRQLNDFVKSIELYSDKYDNLISKDKFVNAFKSYLNSVMIEEKLSYDRSTFDNTTKLLSYSLHKQLYHTNIDYQQYYEGVDVTDLEYDHYYPKVKLLKSGTYVSSILNCWVYTKRSNRSKGARNMNAIDNENVIANKKFNNLIGRIMYEDGFNKYSLEERKEIFEKNSTPYSANLIRHVETLHDLLAK